MPHDVPSSVPLRVGLVGPGWVACDRYLPVLTRRADIEVVGVADRDPERASTTTARYGAGRGVGSLDALLELGPDAVFVTTPPPSHPELVLGALEAGCHVFVEKPIAIRSDDAASMVEAAEHAGRLLCVSHNFLWSHAAREATRHLRGQAVRYATAMQLSSHRRRLPTWYGELPGGLLLDESPHLLYTLDHALGGDLTLDDLRADLDEATGHPRVVELWVRGRTGRGQATMVFDSPVSEWHVGLVADERVVDLDLFRDICVTVPSDGAHTARDILGTSARAIAGHVRGFALAGARYSTGRQFWGHDTLIGEFITAARTGAPSPVPPADALAIARLTDQVLDRLATRP